jgi:hypothetical protein
LIYIEGQDPNKKGDRKMKKYTTVINGTKIERHECEIDAIINAWEEKMNGNTVKVVDDENCKVVYR